MDKLSLQTDAAFRHTDAAFPHTDAASPHPATACCIANVPQQL